VSTQLPAWLSSVDGEGRDDLQSSESAATAFLLSRPSLFVLFVLFSCRSDRHCDCGVVCVCPDSWCLSVLIITMCMLGVVKEYLHLVDGGKVCEWNGMSLVRRHWLESVTESLVCSRALVWWWLCMHACFGVVDSE